jgi:hypothetical protein
LKCTSISPSFSAHTFEPEFGLEEDIKHSVNVRSVYFQMKTLATPSKVAIFGALMLCAGSVLLFISPGPPTWNLRTTLHIGRTINPAYLVEDSVAPQDQIERYRAVVASISDPTFRKIVASTSKFEPDSAARSKRLVFDSLRAHALNDNDIEIELTAASAADCRSAYRTIADRIEQRHALLFEQNKQRLQIAIENYRDRLSQLKTWLDEAKQLNPQSPSEDADSVNKPKSDFGVTWNETREHLRQLEAVESLLKPTTFPPESEVYVYGPLSNNIARLSALAGLAVILCIVVLGFGLEIRSSKRRGSQK